MSLNRWFNAVEIRFLIYKSPYRNIGCPYKLTTSIISFTFIGHTYFVFLCFASFRRCVGGCSLSEGITSLNPRLLNRCRSPVLRTLCSRRCRQYVVRKSSGIVAVFANRGYHFVQPPAIESLSLSGASHSTPSEWCQLPIESQPTNLFENLKIFYLCQKIE